MWVPPSRPTASLKSFRLVCEGLSLPLQHTYAHDYHMRAYVHACMLYTLLAVRREEGTSFTTEQCSTALTHPMEPVTGLALTQERIMASFSLPCNTRQQKTVRGAEL